MSEVASLNGYRPTEWIDDEPAPDLLVVAGLHRLDVGRLLDEPVPEADWLIEGLLERGELCWLSGAGKTGKSMVALFAGTAMLAGRDEFLGRTIGHVRRLVYIDCENRERTIRRRLHWAGVPREMADRIEYFVARSLDVGSPAGLAALEQLADGGAVVFLDSMIGLHRADEDKANEVRRLALGLRGVTERTGATFVGLAHENRQGNLRGSLDWRNAADRILELRKDEAGVRTLSVGDARDGDEKVEPLTFQFSMQGDSLVLVPTAGTPRGRVLNKSEQLAESIREVRSGSPGLSKAETARRLGYMPDHWTFKNAYSKAIAAAPDEGGGNRRAAEARQPGGRGGPLSQGNRPPRRPASPDEGVEMLIDDPGVSAWIEGTGRLTS